MGSPGIFIQESYIHKVEISEPILFRPVHGHINGEYGRIKGAVTFCLTPVVEAVDGCFSLEAKNNTSDNFALIACEHYFPFSFLHIMVEEMLKILVRWKTA